MLIMGRLHRIEFKGYSDKKWHLYNLNLLCTFYQGDTSSIWSNCTRFMSRLKTQLLTIFWRFPCLRRDIQVTVRWGQRKITQPLHADNGPFFQAFYFDQAPHATTLTYIISWYFMISYYTANTQTIYYDTKWIIFEIHYFIVAKLNFSFEAIT